MTDHASHIVDGPTQMEVFEYSLGDGATNMARDHALMNMVGPGKVAFRFYGWEPWCLSLGRNQPAPSHFGNRPRSELSMGVDVVRRPTGGRSVYHGPELTYAFACSDRTAGGPRSVYLKLHRALASGLTSLGVVLDAQDRHDVLTTRRLRPDLTSCFRDPAPGELTVEGRKLVGSAQCRANKKLLQHGSILISDEQGPADLAEPTGSAKAGPGAIGLTDVLDIVPALATIAQLLTDSVAAEFGDRRTGRATPIGRLGRAKEQMYRSQSWGWRLTEEEEVA